MKDSIQLKSFIKSLLTTLALTLNVLTIYQNKVNNTNIFQVELSTVALLFALFYFLYKKKKIKLDSGSLFLAHLFSFFMLFGNSYLKLDSWNLVFGNLKMMAISAFLYLGYFYLFSYLIHFIENLWLNFSFPEIKGKRRTLFRKFRQSLEEHPIRTSFLVLLIFWSIYIIAFYPIILSPDPSFQIKMYFNEHTKYIDWVIRRSPKVNLTTHHPIIHTFLLGGAIQLGRLIGSDNFGLLIYSLFQTAVLAATLSYTIYYTKKLKISNSVRLLLLAIYALVPMFPFYAMSGVKDTIYTCLVILYTMFLLDILLFKKDEKLSLFEIIENTCLIILLMLFRNNGIYVILLSLPFLFLIRKLNRKKMGVILGSSLAIYFVIVKIVIPGMGISDGSIREALSIPFQQTARYVKEHGESIKKEERKAIDKVLGYEDLKERYDPIKADPVKNEFNKDATSEDLKEYFKFWFQGLLKHPDTYLQATMNNVYGYFYPNSTRWYIYYKYDNRITQNDLVDYHYNSLSGIRNVLTGYGVSFPYIPGIGLISNIGFSSWVLFLLVYFVIKQKKKELLIVLAPSLASLLICVASPVNCYFRYAMPYVFMLPFLIVTIQFILNKKEGNYEKKQFKNRSADSLL